MLFQCWFRFSNNSFQLIWFYNYNPGQNIWNKVEKSSKTGQEMFDIYFCIFFDCYCQSVISGGDWALGCDFIQIWDFPNISLFPKMLSLKLSGNSWGNSYTKFTILDIKFHFTCGESDVCLTIVKFQNIMTKVVGKREEEMK